jgi:hypothetical protein
MGMLRSSDSQTSASIASALAVEWRFGSLSFMLASLVLTIPSIFIAV